MKEFKVGLIRVITLEDPELLNLHGRIIEENFPGIKVISKCIPNQPYGIYDNKSEKEAIPKIISLAKKMVKDDINALIISCAADPGLKELREKLNVPVIGAGSASAYLALTISSKIGVLTITDETPKVIREILKEKLIAEKSVENVKNTLDLMKKESIKHIYDAILELSNRGCKAIILGCTGFSTIRIVDRKITGSIILIDPVIACGIIVSYLKRLTMREKLM
ncbi:MAG: aspartate/glutamate racemase family protein [archaeon GB-1867-035]|nr:aspartate/glutamate racemase family protein [Candidatus Culexmicrobium profundum]